MNGASLLDWHRLTNPKAVIMASARDVGGWHTKHEQLRTVAGDIGNPDQITVVMKSKRSSARHGRCCGMTRRKSQEKDRSDRAGVR